jgi:hypothetical protein
MNDFLVLENAQLKDELLITRRKVLRLEALLEKQQKALSRASLITEGLPLWIMVLVVVWMVISCKYGYLAANFNDK